MQGRKNIAEDVGVRRAPYFLAMSVSLNVSQTLHPSSFLLYFLSLCPSSRSPQTPESLPLTPAHKLASLSPLSQPLPSLSPPLLSQKQLTPSHHHQLLQYHKLVSIIKRL